MTNFFLSSFFDAVLSIFCKELSQLCLLRDVKSVANRLQVVIPFYKTPPQNVLNLRLLKWKWSTHISYDLTTKKEQTFTSNRDEKSGKRLQTDKAKKETYWLGWLIFFCLPFLMPSFLFSVKSYPSCACSVLQLYIFRYLYHWMVRPTVSRLLIFSCAFFDIVHVDMTYTCSIFGAKQNQVILLC